PSPSASEVASPPEDASPADAAPDEAPPAAEAPPAGCPLRRWLTVAAFAPDGRQLATACDREECAEDPADTALEIWDLPAGGRARTLEVRSAMIRPQGAGAGLLVASSRPGTGHKDITLLDTTTFRVLHSNPHYCAGATFDAEAKRMLVTGCDGMIDLL